MRHARRLRNRRGERLEPPNLLAADGTEGVFFPVQSEAGEVQVSWDVGFGANLINLLGAFEVPDDPEDFEPTRAGVAFDNAVVTNFDGGSVELDTRVVADVLFGRDSSGQASVRDPQEQLVAQAERTAGAFDSSDFNDSAAASAVFQSVTIDTPLAGQVVVPAIDLYRPFASLSGFATSQEALENGGDAPERTITLFVNVGAFLESPILDSTGVATIRIDLGDGNTVEREIDLSAPGSDLGARVLTIEHQYETFGEFTVSVTGVAPLANGGGGIAIRPTCLPVVFNAPVAVDFDPGGDDTVVLRNESGRLIANVNGEDQDLGASDEVTMVRVEPGGGDNTIDGRQLLATQSLFVPPFFDRGTNTIFGGPATDYLNGGNGPATIMAGAGDDFIIPRDGADIVHGEEGADTIVIGGVGFPNPFNTDAKQIHGGDDGLEDILRVLDTNDDLDIIGSNTAPDGFDGTIRLFGGRGSFPPTIEAAIAGIEGFELLGQSNETFVNFVNGEYFDWASFTLSPEDDIVTIGSSTFTFTEFWGLDGDDRFFGNDQTNFAHGGAGDDDLTGAGGDDWFVDSSGANDLNGGGGNDTYGMNYADVTPGSINTITDSSGTGDTLLFEGFMDGLNVDMAAFGSRQIATDLSIDLKPTIAAPIENVTVLGVGQSIDVSGTSGDNTFNLVPVDSLLNDGVTPGTVRLNDGGGGDDTFVHSPFDLGPDPENPVLPPLLPNHGLTILTGPGSGDVIDLPGASLVTVSFAIAQRAVDVDLDLQGVDQVVDTNGNTIRFESPIRNFVGTGFDDTLRIDAAILPRRIEGGAGTDVVTIDAGGRSAVQTPGQGETLILVDGFAPIAVVDFEQIDLVNTDTPGVVPIRLVSGQDPRLSLDTLAADNDETLAAFSLTEGATGVQQFLLRDVVTEIRSEGLADALTIDALGQPVEVVGNEVFVGDLTPIRLVGFARVVIEDAGLPGDYSGNGRVDAADYTLWRDNLGADAGTLDNDIDGGPIGQAQYETWRTNFGRVATPLTIDLPVPAPVASPGALAQAAATPEALDLAFAQTAPRTPLISETAAADDALLLLSQSGVAAESHSAHEHEESGEPFDESDEDDADETSEDRGLSIRVRLT